MSSLLTNNSAMVALQTLKTINKNLATTQDKIATGKQVATAKDNAAVWGISQTMKTDVSGFKAISESLSLGSATLSVGRDAAETVTDLLDQLKGKIVAAQEDNVDRNKIQADVDALRNQINGVVEAAQFNGLNLINNERSIDILASLNRDQSGNVSSSSITVNAQNLTTDAGEFGGDGALSNITAGAAAVANTANTEDVTFATDAADGDVVSLNFGGQTFTYTATTGALTVTDIASNLAGQISTAGIEGVSATNAAGVLTISSVNKFTEFTSIAGSSTGGTTVTEADGTLERRAETITLGAGVVSEGDSYRVQIDGTNYDYVAGKGETMNDVAVGLKAAIDNAGDADITVQVNQADDPVNTDVTLYVDNNAASVSLAASDNSGGTASGGLLALAGLDVTTDAGAANALQNIEGLIQNAIGAAAEFGSAQGRIQTQSEFVSNLMDGLTSGIGALVDADMEEASAKLQALQVQQQLGIQALSIANQAPQNILALFR